MRTKKIIMLFLIVSLHSTLSAQVEPLPLKGELQLKFDWELHPRFIPETGFTNSTPVVNGYSRLGHKYMDSYVHPTGYGLHITAKVNNGALISGGLNYRWQIAGVTKEEGGANNFNFDSGITTKKTLYAGSSMSVDTDPDVLAMSLFPYRGTYNVKLSAFSARDKKEVKFYERTIQVKDYLILIMGDSFASGEGNPDKTGDYDLVFDDELAVWLEPLAHRSFKGALSLIAAKLEANDPHSCVTLVNVASSGAKTSHGLLFQQHPDWQLKGQIEEAKDYIKDRKVHMILMSIGLNDMGNKEGMSELVNASRSSDFYRSEEYRFAKNVTSAMQFRYDEVREKIELTLGCKDVVLFQMPVQFMRNASGNLTDGCGVLTGMENEDILRLEELGNQLIAKQKQICENYHWVYIDGIRDMFKNHGYCADSQSWFVFALNSLNNQGDINGSIHPNPTGHKKIAEMAFPAVERRLTTVHVPTQPGNTTPRKNSTTKTN